MHTKKTQKTIKWNLPLLTSRIFSTSGQWSLCYVHAWLLLIISMEHSHSWKANNSSVCQQIPCILWNLKVHYHIHNSLPLVPCHPSHFFQTYFKSSLPTMPFSSKQSLFLAFYHQNPVCNIFLPLTCHKPCTSHSPWLDHLDKICGEEHKS